MSDFDRDYGQERLPPSYPPRQPQRERVDSTQVAVLILLAILVPVLGPFAAIVVGAINSRRSGGTTLIVIGALLMVAQTIFLPIYIVSMQDRLRKKALEAEVKENLHSIQLQIERYATENTGDYPFQVGLTGLDGWVDKYSTWPRNPITGLHMKNVPFGAEPSAGEFTYIPMNIDGRLWGYYLMAYGFEDTTGIDVDGDGAGDHVVIILSSYPSDIEPPPLEDLLRDRLPASR